MIRGTRRLPLRPLLAFGVGGAMVLATLPTLALGQPDDGGAHQARPSAQGTSDNEPDLRPGAYQVTLITGDVVRVGVDPSGNATVEVEPVQRPDGTTPAVSVLQTDDSITVVPADAKPALASGLVDQNLFDVATLIDNGYVDGAADSIPLIVRYDEPMAASTLSTEAAVMAAVAEPAVALTSINGAAVAVDTSTAADFWAELQGSVDATTAAQTAEPAVNKIWLDQKVEVELAESVPLIGAPQAWDAGYDGSGVRVAVLDTGIDAEHPDLVGRVVAQQSFIAGESVIDGHGHGTHVASTIAGTGAGDPRMKGVAPGADLIIGKVLSNGGSGSFSGIIQAMEWATRDQNADIVSMSLGCDNCAADGTGPEELAVDQLTAETGALFVIAAGNAGPGSQTVASPGSATSALTVAATDKNDGLADFSSRGPRLGDFAFKPEIAGPGVAIAAARAAGTAMGTPISDLYTAASGTSMATPHVAGAAALVAQRYPGLEPDELKAILTTTSVDVGHRSFEQGAGRVDALRATSQDVVSQTALLDFGRIGATDSYPVTLANHGSQATTMSVTTQFGTPGGPAPDGTLVASPSEVTIPAGGTATIDVTYHAPADGLGVYSGRVVVSNADEQLAIPAVAVEYSDISVRVRTRDGADDDADQCAQVVLVGVDEITAGTLVDRELCGASDTLDADFKVPAGTYWAATHGTWIESGIGRSAVVTQQEVAVDDGSTVELDLADAVAPTISLPKPTADTLRDQMRLSRSAVDSTTTTFNVVAGAGGVNDDAEATASITLRSSAGPAQVGTFRLNQTWGFAAPGDGELGERDYHYALFPIYDSIPVEYEFSANEFAAVNNRVYAYPDDRRSRTIGWYPTQGTHGVLRVDGVPPASEATWYFGPVTQAQQMVGISAPQGVAGTNGVDRGAYRFDRPTDYEVRWGERPWTPAPTDMQGGTFIEHDFIRAFVGWGLAGCNGCREGNMFGGHVGYVSPDGRNGTGEAGLKLNVGDLIPATDGLTLWDSDGNEIEPFTHHPCDGHHHICSISVGSHDERVITK